MADDFADKFRRLIHLAGVYSFGTIVEKFFGFVLIPVYTYYLSPDDFGIIGLMTLVTLLAYQVLGSPINTGFMRFYYNPDFREIRKEFAFVTMMCTLAACTLAAIVLFSLSSVAAAFFLESENLAPIVRVYAGILLFRAVFDLGANMLKMEERARHFVLANWIVFLVSSTVTLVGLIVMHMGVMALILGQFAGLAAGSAMVLPFYISQSRPTRAVGMLREPLKFGYPYLLLGVSNQLLQMGDRYLLKVFTSLTEVGLYSFGYRIADLIMILLVSPLAKALQPLFLKLEDDPETLREFVKKTCTYYYVFGSFICLGLAVFSREFVQLIAQKESFHASWPVIPVIAYSHLHYGLGYFLGWGIVMSKQSVYMTTSIILAVIVNILLNVILIPDYGIMGSAIATLAAILAWNGQKIYYTNKLYPLHFEYGKLLIITISTLAAFGISVLVRFDSMFTTIFFKVLLLVLFFIFQIATGIFSLRNLSFIRQIRSH